MAKTKNNSTQSKQEKSQSVKNKFTRIDFSYINMYDSEGWVQIQPDSFIRPVGTKIIYPLVKAQGIPIAPKKHYFKKKGEKLSYTLFFPPLPKDIKKIDIIEKENDSENFFNFYGISLEQIKKKKIYVNSFSDEAEKNSDVKFDKNKIYAVEAVKNGYFPNERTVAVLRYCMNEFDWHILEGSSNGWYNHYQTFKEAWSFCGMNMVGKKRVFSNEKDFFMWALSVVNDKKNYK